MKFIEKDILEIAQSFLKGVGIDYEHYRVKRASFDPEDELERGVNEGKSAALWTVVIEDDLFDTLDFLTVSDETGAPLYARSKHGVTEITQDADGKYVWKD